jgi:cell division control protein 6
MDPKIKSNVANNIIFFPKYNLNQLFDILTERVNEGFHEGVIPSSTVETIVEIASESGDARYAIELLWRSGKKAESERSPFILPEHVRIAQTSVYPFPKNQLMDLMLDNQIVLLSISKLFVHHTDIYIISLNQLKTQLKSDSERYIVKKPINLIACLENLNKIGIIKLKYEKSSSKSDNISYIFLELPAKDLFLELENFINSKYHK